MGEKGLFSQMPGVTDSIKRYARCGGILLLHTKSRDSAARASERAGRMTLRREITLNDGVPICGRSAGDESRASRSGLGSVAGETWNKQIGAPGPERELSAEGGKVEAAPGRRGERRRGRLQIQEEKKSEELTIQKGGT